MAKESNHWYDKTGKAAYTTLDSKGKERSTNLRDARKHGYVPSVTTILGVAAKPSLENWKVNQAINAALALEKRKGETDTQFLYRCKEYSRSVGKEAAEKGTIIHAMIEQGFEGGEETKPYIKIGIYRIGDTGTTTYVYKNLLIKNKKKSSFEKVDNSKGATKFFVIVSRKSDPSVQFRFEDKDNGKARTQALKKCFTAGHDDCEVSLVGTK